MSSDGTVATEHEWLDPDNRSIDVKDQKENPAKTDQKSEPTTKEKPENADEDKSCADKDDTLSPSEPNQQVLGDKKPANKNMTVEVKRCNICKQLKTDQKFTKPHTCDPTLLPPTTSMDYKFSTPSLQQGKDRHLSKRKPTLINKQQRTVNTLYDYSHECLHVDVDKPSCQNVAKSRTTCVSTATMKCAIDSCANSIRQINLNKLDSKPENQSNKDSMIVGAGTSVLLQENDGIVIERGSCSSNYTVETDEEILEP